MGGGVRVEPRIEVIVKLKKSREGSGRGGQGSGERRISYCENAKKKKNARREVRVDVKRRLV